MPQGDGAPEVSMRGMLLALTLTVAAGLLEGLAAGPDPRARLAEVRQPSPSPPMAVWVAVAALYYLSCFMVAARLLVSGPTTGARAVALGLLVALLLTNALWNLAFFRRADLNLSWWVSRAYALLAVGLAIALWRLDRGALLILLPYFLYLVYGTWWVYKVWQLSSPDASARGHTPADA